MILVIILKKKSSIKSNVFVDIIKIKSQLKSLQDLRFLEKSLLKTVLRCNANLEKKLIIEFFSENKVNITSIDEIQLFCVCIVGALLNLNREPLFLSFIQMNLLGLNMFCELETKNLF